MIFSIVITTFNEEKNIAPCLDSILNQTRKPDEIILVDDGSCDKTIKIASMYPIKIIKIKHQERSMARNIGWKKAQGEIIIFAEADSVFSPNWIQEIIKTFKSGADAVIDRRKMYQPKTFLQKCLDAQFDIRYANYKPFSAWAFKKEILKKTNGFDINLTQSEDRDLGKRILKKDYKILLASKALQYHKGEPQNFVDYIKRAYLSEKRKTQGYFQKYSREISWTKYILIFLFIILLCLAPFSKPILLLDVFLLFLILVGIFIKIYYLEKGRINTKLKYIFGLSFLRFTRIFSSFFGFLIGKSIH